MSMEQSLYEAAKDILLTVISIPKENMLESIGIFPGAQIVKKNTYPLGGPVSLTLGLKGSRNVAVGKRLAEEILVSEVPELVTD